MRTELPQMSNHMTQDNATQCPVAVYHRDIYRFTECGDGLKLHYRRARCKRRGNSHQGLCVQHWRMLRRGHSLRRFDNYEAIRQLSQ